MISDGEETVEVDTIEEVKPILIEKGVTVHSILYSDEADPKIESLSADTCGKSFFDIGLGNSTDLLAGLTSIAEVISADNMPGNLTAFAPKVTVSVSMHKP